MEGLVLFVWLFFCFLVGRSAEKKNRSFGGWFVIAALFSPIIGGLVLLLMDDVKGVDKSEK